MTESQMINAIVVQLDKLEVSKFTNHILLHDVFKMLQSLKERLEEKEVADDTADEQR